MHLSSLVLAGVLLALPSIASAQEPPCRVDRHAGFTDEDAEAVEQVLCPELARSLPGENRVRIARLGSKVALTLESKDPNGAERPPAQILLAGLEEVPVAGPRLVQASAGTPIAETADVTNVVGGEARPYKKKSGLISVWIGSEAITTSAAAASGGGFATTFGLGAEQWLFVADLRLGGSDKLNRFALGSGFRFMTSPTDTSVFVGAGVGFESITVRGADNGGAAGYVEVGVDLLRTRKFGGALTLRADLPMFAIEKTEFADGSSYGFDKPTTTTTSYAPIFSAGVSVRF